MAKNDKQIEFTDLVAKLIKDGIDDALDKAPERALSANHHPDTSPFLKDDYVSDASVVEVVTDEMEPDAYEPRIEDRAYSDDGRIIHLMSDGSMRFYDPYSEDIEYLDVWQEFDDSD